MTPDILDHPRFGIWSKSEPATGSDRGETAHDSVRLRTGYVCKECNDSVLAYTHPKKCEDHL